VIAVSDAVQIDAPTRYLERATHTSCLLDPVHGKPRGQPVRIGVVAECIVNAVECVFDSHVVTLVGEYAGFTQLGLCERQPAEREVIQVCVVGHPALVQVQCQRSRIVTPHADVVAGFSAACQVQIDLKPESFFWHDEFPEQGVARSLPGHRPVPKVVGGAERVMQFLGCGHGSSPRKFANALRVSDT
jgi:hypothetical protein